MHSQKRDGGTLRLGLVGGSGAMGQRLLRLLPNHPTLSLACLLQREGHGDTLGDANPGTQQAVLITSCARAFANACDVVVDFSAPTQCAALAPALATCAQKKAYIVASTGLQDADHAALDAAAGRIAVLQAANLSLGVQVLIDLVQRAAAQLSLQANWDVEIVEMHHRRKVDGPSGTALALGEAMMAVDSSLTPRVGRDMQPDGRPSKQLGYSVVRGGDIAGEHSVLFLGDNERLELTHRSQSADVFATGALNACWRLWQLPPGRYTMQTIADAAAHRATCRDA